jgi:aminopeptidase N
VGNTIEIQLDRSYDTGESVQVAVDYEGYPVSAGFGAFRWWLRNGELVIATLSEPFYARYWWPCKDALDDKATMQMWVTVPSDLVAFSNGSLTATEALPGSRTRYRWHEQYPMIPYLASLAVTSYESYELQYDYEQGGVPGSMPVSCHFYPDHWDSVAGEPLPAYCRPTSRGATSSPTCWRLSRASSACIRGSTKSTTRWRPGAPAV